MRQAIITIDSNQWTVKVASTQTELMAGLAGRTSLTPSTGMLFILPSAQQITVTTQNMLFPIDIIFIANNTVLDVASNIQPGYEVTEETPCDMFLEVNAGEAVEVSQGDTVSVEYLSTVVDNISQIMSFAVPLAAIGFVSSMAGGMASLIGGSSHSSSEIRRLGRPRTEEERAKVHEEFYGTKELPARGKGLVERGELGSEEEQIRRELDKMLQSEWIEHQDYVLEGLAKKGYSRTAVRQVLDKEIARLQGRRLGEPKTEVERKEAHELKYGTQELPPRGSGEYITITDPGKTTFKPGEVVSKDAFDKENERVRKLGEREAKGISSREHHSMWMTPEQRKECEREAGAIACRWAEEFVAPGDFESAKKAAKVFYEKMREAVGIA